MSNELITVLIDLQKESREDQRRYHDEQKQYHEKQNATNEKVASALIEVANEIKVSNQKLSQNEKITEEHEEKLSWIEPVANRSKKSQERFDNILTKVIGTIIVAVVLFFAGAGAVKIINPEAQKQEQSNGN